LANAAQTLDTINVRNFFIIPDVNVHRAVIQAIKTVNTGVDIPKYFISFDADDIGNFLDKIHKRRIRAQVSAPESFNKETDENDYAKNKNPRNRNILNVGYCENRTEFHIQVLSCEKSGYCSE